MSSLELSPFYVTPVASFLSRCVARGAVPQEQIDSALSDRSPAFSSHLCTAEQRITAQRELDQLQFQFECLQLDGQSADVAHPAHLSVRFQKLQSFCSHLQDLLRDQDLLRQRLLRPHGRTHLPVPAHLHRFVLEVVRMCLDFVETLEQKISSLQSIPRGPERLSQTDSSLSSLLSLSAEVRTLSAQVLQWKEVRAGVLSDSAETSSALR